jgi:hypothetical protein
MANDRIYYAVQQVGFKKDTAPGDAYTAARGVQSVGMTTNFDLTQVFQLGEVSIYENIEEIPNVELTASKVLDGSPLLYHLATLDAVSPTLSGRSTARTFVAVSIFADTNDSATGTAAQIVESSGMFASSIGYNIPVDDNMTEDLTLVGNDRLWKNDTRVTEPTATGRQGAMVFDGAFNNLGAPTGLGGVQRRENIIFSGDGVDYSLIPTEIPGIGANGINDLNNASRARLSNITVNADLGREDINELGRRSPYARFVTFPLEVTSEFEVTSTSGDLISATEEGILSTGVEACESSGNLQAQTIRLATCEGTRIYLGSNNKLSSVNYGGGDAGGGNVSTTYAYTTFNDFTVLHSADPNPSGSAWWADRSSYLS